jgi:hypothetical protein
MGVIALLGSVLNGVLLYICNERGETGAGGATGAGASGASTSTGSGDKSFTQDQVDAIIKERLARTKEQYKDYDDLKKFKTEAEQKQNELTQKQLEEQRNYDEAKKGYEKKISDYNELVKQKDQAITSMKISHALAGEVSKQNGYVEESMALLIGSTVIDPNTGEIKIKGKDSNGIDTTLTVEQGVKQFLEARPHLVKVAGRKGGDTNSGTGNTGSGAGKGAQDLSVLNEEYARAQQSGDYKRAGELKKQIRTILTTKK